MKEELKQKMISVIGSYSNALIESIAEKCAQVAIDYYKERCQELIISGVVESAVFPSINNEGTPLLDEYGKKICNCVDPNRTYFPDGAIVCMNCWGQWYH